MSFAVIQSGGKQYKVKSGEILKIEKLPDSKPETKIEFNEILAYGDDKIIEVAAILFKDGEPKKTFSTLVNPGKNIPSFITGITGISNSMVNKSPKESEIINDLMEIIGSHPVVAHNVKFDWSFIESLCKKNNLDIPSNPLYDTLQLARSVLFDHPVFNLSALSLAITNFLSLLI